MKVSYTLAYIFALMLALSITGCVGRLGTVSNGKMVFQSDRDGNYNLWIMNANTSELKNLTNIPPSAITSRTNVDPIPSPDGKAVAFVSNRDGNSEIYIVDVVTGVQKDLTKNKANDYSPTWSPDGKYIAFVSERDAVSMLPAHGITTNNIYIMNADGLNVRRLTTNNVAAGYNGLAWSPDGMKLLLNLTDVGPTGDYIARGISIMDLSNLGVTVLTALSDKMSCCAKWSPDGNHILYSVLDRGFENIYVMKADGTNQIALTDDASYYDMDPSWSPDGRYVLFSSNRDGQYHLYLMNANGSNQKRLTGGLGEDRYPVWLARP